MFRSDCIALAFALAANLAHAQIPPTGTDAGDGFTVAAHWAFHYRSKGMTDDGALGGPMRSLDAPLNYEREVIGEADVTEEVNKSNGQIRAVVRNGRWSIRISGLHYKDKYGNRIDAGKDAEDSGEKMHAAIGYGYDEKLKQPTVHFAIKSNEDVETPQFKVPYHPLNENISKVWVSGDMKIQKFNSGVSGGCDVPFQKSYLYYRKRTPEDGSNTPYTEIVIERSAREIEAEIKPADDYEYWVPTLNGTAPFEARIVDPPGLRADEWQFALTNVSNLPGICNNANIPDEMNAAWQGQLANSSPDLIFDFRRYGKTEANFKPVDKPWKELHTAKAMAGASFAVSCLDWGAYGRISAKALVDGHWIDAKCRKTGEEFIRIPWATTDQPQTMAMHAKTASGEEKYHSHDPAEDEDPTPVGASLCRGDGLTAFQEYRGFYVRDGGKFSASASPIFQRLDPDKKDVFIFMDDQTAFLLSACLADFEKASGLAVHRIGSNENWLWIDPTNRIANFNRGPDDAPQCALHLELGSLEGDELGICFLALGPPRRVDRVIVDYAKCMSFTYIPGNFAQQTVVHELGHGVGIPHHGFTNYSSKGFYVAMEGGQNAGDADCAMRYNSADFYLHHQNFARFKSYQLPELTTACMTVLA